KHKGLFIVKLHSCIPAQSQALANRLCTENTVGGGFNGVAITRLAMKVRVTVFTCSFQLSVLYFFGVYGQYKYVHRRSFIVMAFPRTHSLTSSLHKFE